MNNRKSTHRSFTVENVIETLKNMDVANIEDMCYMSTYTSSEICTALNAVMDPGFPYNILKHAKRGSNLVYIRDSTSDIFIKCRR